MQIQFDTKKGKFIALSVSEFDKYEISFMQGDPDIVGIKDGGLSFLGSLPEYCCERIPKQGIKCNAEIIGLASKINIEQVCDIVDFEIDIANNNEIYFFNYNEDAQFNGFEMNYRDSLQSLLVKNKIYSENPIGELEPIIDEPNIHSQYYANQQYNNSLWHKYKETTSKEWLVIKILN